MTALGERVVVLSRRRAGEDGSGEPVWEWVPHPVDGCLVRPLAGADADDPLSPDGVDAAYSVAFPKSYGGPALAGCRVALVERGMSATDVDAALPVVGSPDVTRPCPTPWDTLATLGARRG